MDGLIAAGIKEGWVGWMMIGRLIPPPSPSLHPQEVFIAFTIPPFTLHPGGIAGWME
jgi:hypothetical protein